MHYFALSARNTAHKAARNYESLKMADNRPLIEQQIRENIIKTLTEEKLADKITVSQVQVRAITPADVIVNSANELVRAQNELKTKEVEAQTAKKRGRTHRRSKRQCGCHWLHKRDDQFKNRRRRCSRQSTHDCGAL
ncbi:MAG: hypothetical protein H7Z77_09260 [Chitinophagaceae bacterium]|nr:hypothetical protein [Polaromonas sp.]